MASWYRSYHFKKQGVRHTAVFCSIVTLKILRLNYFSPCEITCGKYCPVMDYVLALGFTDILFSSLKLRNVVKRLSVKKKKKNQ